MVSNGGRMGMFVSIVMLQLTGNITDALSFSNTGVLQSIPSCSTNFSTSELAMTVTKINKSKIYSTVQHNYLSFVKEIFRWRIVRLSMSWKMTSGSRNMVLYASHVFHSFICLPQHVKCRFFALFLLLSRFHPSHL